MKVIEMLSIQEIIFVLIGLTVFVFLLGKLNDFVGGVPFLTYVGTPVALGIFVFVGGLIVLSFVRGQVNI